MCCLYLIWHVSSLTVIDIRNQVLYIILSVGYEYPPQLLGEIVSAKLVLLCPKVRMSQNMTWADVPTVPVQ